MAAADGEAAALLREQSPYRPWPSTTNGSSPGVGTSHVCAFGVPVVRSTYQFIVLSQLSCMR